MFRLRLLQRLPLGSQVARKSRQFTDVTECTNEFIDITGYRVSISDPSALALYNESLTNFLTHEKDPSVQLNLIRERNKNVGMVNSLLVFQMIRQPKPHDLTEEKKITEILRSLDENMREGKQLAIASGSYLMTGCIQFYILATKPVSHSCSR